MHIFLWIIFFHLKNYHIITKDIIKFLTFFIMNILDLR